MNYAELDRLIDRVAAGLQRDGVKPRDSVAICALSSPEYGAVFFGALKAGAAIVPLSPSATPESLLAMLVDSGTKHFFLDKAVADAILNTWLGPKPGPGADFKKGVLGQ